MNNVKKVIALGFFDGVHLGHGALLRRVKERAEELQAVPTAFTFDRHPASQMTGHMTPLINSDQDRGRLMRQCYGMEQVIMGQFNLLKTMPWDQFITQYLMEDHGAVHLVAGHDFRFGYKGQGNPQRLQELCQTLGIGCDIIPKIEQEGITVSSTYIRSLLEQGEMERAREFLGHPHMMTETVRHGKKLGSKLGFPTVNLVPPEQVLVPAYGVYATKVVLEDGSAYSAVTNVGVRPTVDDGNAVTVEPYLLDFHGDLYGKQVQVEYYHRIRGEKRFNSLEELKAEVLANAEETRAYFQKMES